MLDDSHYQTRLLGICGSTRKGSWNLALLRTAAALTADDVSLSIQNVGDLPHYDQDRDDTLGGTDTPGPVVDLRRSVSEADALIVASPEYNWSFSGVLKNALDWCSRPAFASILAGKPTLLIGASGGPAGTGRAQLHLRQVLLSTRTPVLIDCLQVPNAADHFDAAGCITSPEIKSQLQSLIATLVTYTEVERSQLDVID